MPLEPGASYPTPREVVNATAAFSEPGPKLSDCTVSKRLKKDTMLTCWIQPLSSLCSKQTLELLTVLGGTASFRQKTVVGIAPYSLGVRITLSK